MAIQKGHSSTDGRSTGPISPDIRNVDMTWRCRTWRGFFLFHARWWIQHPRLTDKIGKVAATIKQIPIGVSKSEILRPHFVNNSCDFHRCPISGIKSEFVGRPSTSSSKSLVDNLIKNSISKDKCPYCYDFSKYIEDYFIYIIEYLKLWTSVNYKYLKNLDCLTDEMIYFIKYWSWKKNWEITISDVFILF